MTYLAARDDAMVTVAPLLDVIGDSSAFLAVVPPADEMDTLLQHERTGRALGDGLFVATREAGRGRRLRLFWSGRRSSRGGERLIA